MIKITGKNGFTLIEIAMVMIIAGIIISVITTTLPSLIQSGKIKKSGLFLKKWTILCRGIY